MTYFIGIAILAIYLALAIHKDGIPTSISDTFYTYGKYAFTIIMWAVSILMAIAFFDVTPENKQFLVFLTSAGILLVGGAPHCRDSYEKKAHYIGAIMFAVFGLAWSIILNPVAIIAGIPFAILGIFNKKSWIFYGELAIIAIMSMSYILTWA